MTPRIWAIIIGCFILFVISIPLIEGTHEQKVRKVYPEVKQDTLVKAKPDGENI